MYDEQVVKIAVDWWMEKITKRHHHDNGDKSDVGAMTMLMADMNYIPLSKDSEEKFKRKLSELLKNKMEMLLVIYAGENFSVSIGCDYGPDDILGRAADAADVNYLNFPFKTNMIITNDSVSVSDGYRSEYTTIYKTDKKKEIKNADNV